MKIRQVLTRTLSHQIRIGGLRLSHVSSVTLLNLSLAMASYHNVLK
jgi:hypothetical protein